MRSGAQLSARVNPYSRWVYDHPDSLLPEPTPALLKEKRRDPAQGSGRLIVELGSGSGNFLLQLARAFPKDHLVGFELRFKRLVKAARKLEKEGHNRVWLLRELGEKFGDYFAPASIDRIYINFPDPWPKFAHWKKRMINPPLLEAMEKTLKKDGKLYLKTDHSGYFLHCLSLIRNRPGWKIVGFSNDLHRYGPPVFQAKTEFEQLFASKGKAIFFLMAEHEGNRN